MKIEPLKQGFKVGIEAKIHPSEDPVKVKEAIRNLVKVGEPEVDEETGFATLESEDENALNFVYLQFRSRQTLRVARRLLLEHAYGDCTWIFFNKQAAYVGVVSACEQEGESPLGPIKVKICCKDIAALIEWLAPG